MSYSSSQSGCVVCDGVGCEFCGRADSPRSLEAVPHPVVPHLLQVIDAAMPPGSPRCVARANVRTGEVWKTRGSRVPMREIRDAVTLTVEERRDG